MARARCPTCDQSTSVESGACEFCGHVFDEARARKEADDVMRRARASVPAASKVTAPSVAAGQSPALLPVGDLFSQTLDVYGENAGAFIFLTAVTLLPSLAALYGPVYLLNQSNVTGVMVFAAALAPIVVAAALAPASAAAVTFGTARFLDGRPASLGECLRGGLGGLLPALGAAIFAGLLVALGTVLLILPGLYLEVVLFAATPAAVVERLGPFRALERSAALTRGARWSIFALVVGVSIVGWIARHGLEMAGGTIRMIPNGYLIVPLLAWGGLVLAGSFHATGAAVAYCRLREARGEGLPR